MFCGPLHAQHGIAVASGRSRRPFVVGARSPDSGPCSRARCTSAVWRCRLVGGMKSSLVGAASPSGHSISNVSCGRPGAGAGGKARAQRCGRAVAPCDGAQSVFRQAKRQWLGVLAAQVVPSAADILREGSSSPPRLPPALDEACDDLNLNGPISYGTGLGTAPPGRRAAQ